MYQMKKRSFDEAIEDDGEKDYNEHQPLYEDESLGIYSETDGRASTEMGDNDDIVEKHRERNREHAKKTRLRKKALIDGMKGRLLELQREYARLEQLLEESNTANILLCLSLSTSPTVSNIESKSKFEDREEVSKQTVLNSVTSSKNGNIIDQLRNKVRVEAAQKLRDRYENLSGSSTSSNEDSSNKYTLPKVKGDSVDSENGSNTDNIEEDQLNCSEESKKSFSWKNGDEISILEGLYKKDSTLDFEYQKRERNRMHARLTRDRKKLFTSRLMQAIQHLERQNMIMRNRLDSVISNNNNNSNSNKAEEKQSQHNQNQLNSYEIKIE